jgi:phosphoadenosine phosphosulfate reductase
MHQKKEKYQASSSKKTKKETVRIEIVRTRKGPQTRENRAENRSRDFNRKPSCRKSSGSEKLPDKESFSKKKSSPRFGIEDNYIFWCKKCNLPL